MDDRARRVFAQQVEGRVNACWQGAGGEVHTRILRRMRQVLLEDAVYPYLGDGARRRLAQARTLARQTGLARGGLVEMGGGQYCVFPWLGTVGFRTLQRMLRSAASGAVDVARVSGRTPYYLTFILTRGNRCDLDNLLRLSGRTQVTPGDLLSAGEVPEVAKYDPFVPPRLLRLAFAEDHLDVAEAASASAELAARPD